MSIAIEISDTQGHLKVDRAAVVELVKRVLIAEKHPLATVSIALVDNATIHRLNRLHLGHDWPTDVITFPLSDLDEPALSGELVVSTEMAVAVAFDAGGDPRDELALYLIHGLLHLCGYDDSSAADALAMTRRQAELLRLMSG